MLISVILCFTDIAFSQSNKLLYHYKGSAGISTVNISENFDWCFDRAIIGHSIWVGTGFFNTNIKSNAILNNSLSNVSRSIANRPNITFTVSDIAKDDYFRNNVIFETSSGFNQAFMGYQIDYTMSTSVDLNSGISSINGSFPIVNPNFPASVQKYLSASTLVESKNAVIISTASSITSGCTDLRTAILKLSKWIEANIEMLDTNPSNQSTVVKSNTEGDCDGVAHLLAAFCRSLNIPARIVSGYWIENSFSVPINETSTQTFASGNGTTWGRHTVCEIYIPSSGNWVRCDPALRTVFFGWQNFIKMATGSESTNQMAFGYGPGHLSTTQNPVPVPTSFTITPAVSISSPSANYSFVKSELFTGTAETGANGYLYCAADPTAIVGFNDKVTIQNPPSGTTYFGLPVPNNTYLMNACSPANFYAFFETGSTPETYIVGFDWSMVLYRSNGEEYVYAQQSGSMSNINTPNNYGEGFLWQPTIGVLPAYDWLLDPSGNIYGKVKMTVHINDGDTKSDETTIGVSPYNNIQNVTYNTNTTINACAKPILTNVSISGTPTVIINTNGLGATIKGPFKAPLGSKVIINK